MKTKSVIMFSCFVVVLSLLSSMANAAVEPGSLVSGKVTNLKMEPIEGAKVVVEAEKKPGIAATIFTDATGNYFVKMPFEGAFYWITINKDGYKNYRTRYYGFKEKTINCKLEPSLFPVGGKITDKAGEPIQGAKIVFEQDGGRNGIQSAISDENGNYSTGIPESAIYWVTVVKDGYKTHRSRFMSTTENTVNRVLMLID